MPGRREEKAGNPRFRARWQRLDGAAPVPGVLERELDHQPTSGVAVDQASGEGTPLGTPARGDVPLDNGSSVAAFTASGMLVQRFWARRAVGGSGVAVDGLAVMFRHQAGEGRVDVFVPEELAGAFMRWWMLCLRRCCRRVRRGFRRRSTRGRAQRIRVQVTAPLTVRQARRRARRFPSPAGEVGAGFGDGAFVTVEGLRPASACLPGAGGANALGSSEGVPAPNTFTTLPAAGVLPDRRPGKWSPRPISMVRLSN